MKLHLVDGTFELFRAHYTKRPGHTAPDGTERKATVGVVENMLALLRDADEGVTHIAAAFDNPVRCFRNDLFDGYKTEDGVDPELLQQFDPVEEAVDAVGITVWSMDRYEADDALATAASTMGHLVEQVRILTPDKDLGQVIQGRKVVTVDRIRRKELDEDGLRAKIGVSPESVPDYLALIGDTADGIPGLDGWGEKSAAAVLARYKKLEEIPDDAAKWDVKVRGAEKLAATLREHRDEAALYRTLATLVRDAPLKESFAELEWKGVPRRKFTAWCERLGTKSVIERVHKWNEDG